MMIKKKKKKETRERERERKKNNKFLLGFVGIVFDLLMTNTCAPG